MVPPAEAVRLADGGGARTKPGTSCYHGMPTRNICITSVPASMSALLGHAGFFIRQLSTAHFESVVYPDSLRILATPRQPAQAQHAALLARFHSVLDQPFVVYGIGGDFNNYVAPVLADLNVVALVDSNPQRIGQTVAGRIIELYDAAKFAGMPVLVSSLSYQCELTALLRQRGVPAQAIFPLDAISR